MKAPPPGRPPAVANTSLSISDRQPRDSSRRHLWRQQRRVLLPPCRRLRPYCTRTWRHRAGRAGAMRPAPPVSPPGAAERALKPFVLGGLAGCGATVIVQPLDTIKVRRAAVFTRASLLRPVDAAEGAPREDRCALRGGGAASSPCGARCVARGARRPPERLAFPHARVLSRFERRVGARACGGAGWSRSVEGCVRGHSIPWHARVPRQARVIRLPPELTSATWRLPSAGGAAAGGRGRRWSRQLDAGGGTRACVSGWRRARAVQRPERGAAAAGDVYDGADGHLPLAERLALGVGARGAAAADGGEGGLRASGGIHWRVRRDAGGPDACAHAGEGGGHRGERVLGRRRSAFSTSALAEPGCHKRGGCASVRSDTFGLVSDAAAMGKKIRFRNQVDARSTALTEFYPMHPDAGGCAQAARGAPQLPRRV